MPHGSLQTRSAFAALFAVAVVATGCGGSNKTTTSSTSPAAPTTSTQGVNPNAKEKSPPGDIPDSTVFVRFKLPAGGFSVRVPEGWARTGGGPKLIFTSNYNSVTVEKRAATGALTAAAVKRQDVPALAHSLQSFKLESIGTIHRGGGNAIRIRYLAKSKPNPVTGKSIMDAVEQYLYVHNGNEAVITLAGPNGADNVDAWRTISDSVRWGA